MEQYPNNTPQLEEEEGIDLVALVKGLWKGRKTIILCTVIFMVLGLVAALTMKRTYTVNTTMVPQITSRSNSSLSSLASLAGFDLGTANMGSTDLSPLVYPQIVNSVPFLQDLLHTPLHYQKADTAVSTYTYIKEYTKPTVMGTILKYTVGLPGVILGALRKEKPEFMPAPDSSASQGPKPIIIPKDEEKMLRALSRNVSLTVDKKEGYLTLTVVGSEPLQTAEMAVKAQQLLQDEVTRFRTEKAQGQLDYVQARYNEIKAETESYQSLLATLQDRSQQMPSARSRMELERVRTKYNVASSIYSEMAKQLEQSKMQVKRDTPMFSILQPVTVPRQPSNSRAKTLIVWTFLGIILGCGIVLAKDYLPKIKEMFSGSEE